MDLSELSAFAASLNHLEREEIQKAKVLFIKNQITTYNSMCYGQILFLIWIGSLCVFMCIFLLFISVNDHPLLALLPLLFLSISISSIRNEAKSSKQQILNALEVWKEDLGYDYIELKTKLERTKSSVPIISYFLNT